MALLDSSQLGARVQIEGSTSRTLSALDNGKILVFTANTAITLTFPTGLPVDFSVMAIQRGTGQISWAGAGITFLLDPDQTGHTRTKGVNSRVSFTYGGVANTFDVIGGTAA